MSVGDAVLEDLVARRDIMAVLTRYCTALDRADLAMMEQVYWPDGGDRHGIYVGDAKTFIPFIINGIQIWFEVTTHAISNIDIVVDGDRAASEAYLLSVCRVRQPQAAEIFGDAYLARHGNGTLVPDQHQFMMGGRYLDRFERRGGEWRIFERQVVLDWNDNGPSTEITDEGMFKTLRPRGRYGPSDPVYEFFGGASKNDKIAAL